MRPAAAPGCGRRVRLASRYGQAHAATRAGGKRGPRLGYVLWRVQLGARDRLAAAPLGTAVREPRAADTEDLTVGKQGKGGAADEGIDPRAGRSPGAGSGGVDAARL